MAVSIRAAVCRAFGAPLSIEPVTLADPGHGELRVRLKACAICHSDITFADGLWGGALPLVLGHEAAGVVEETGPGVTRYKPGDHVVVTLIRSCGSCHHCSGGDGFLCESSFPLDSASPLADAGGEVLGHGLRTGAFAEAVIVEQSQLVAIPDDIGFDVASLLACGVITGVGAVTNTVKMPSGAYCAVVGCGGVGLSTVQGARLAGARMITAIDVVEEKLATARSFGATHAINGGQGNVAEAIWAMTGGRGMDYVFVTVGAQGAINDALSYTGRKGCVVIVGMPGSDVSSSYNPASFAGFGQSIIGSKMGSAHIHRDIPWLVDLYRDGRLKLDEMISGRFGLDQINEAIASTRSGHALRNVIMFDP